MSEKISLDSSECLGLILFYSIRAFRFRLYLVHKISQFKMVSIKVYSISNMNYFYNRYCL